MKLIISGRQERVKDIVEIMKDGLSKEKELYMMTEYDKENNVVLTINPKNPTFFKIKMDTNRPHDVLNLLYDMPIKRSTLNGIINNGGYKWLR